MPRGPNFLCSFILGLPAQTTWIGGQNAIRNAGSSHVVTRMVQLPATAAIEYVAACWVSGAGGFLAGGFLSGGAFVRGCFCPGGLLSGVTFVRGAYARSPQVQCVYAASRLSVPSIVARRTKKNKKRQTRPRSSAGSRPPLAEFSGYVEVEAHYIFYPSTIWVRPLFTELGPKNPPKSRFCHEANE